MPNTLTNLHPSISPFRLQPGFLSRRCSAFTSTLHLSLTCRLLASFRRVLGMTPPLTVGLVPLVAVPGLGATQGRLMAVQRKLPMGALGVSVPVPRVPLGLLSMLEVEIIVLVGL